MPLSAHYGGKGAKVMKSMVDTYGAKKAKLAQEEFERVFKQKKLPEQIPTVIYDGEESQVWIGHLLVRTGCLSSTSQVRRLIQQGGLYWNNEKVENIDLKVSLEGEPIVRLGRTKFYRITQKAKE